MNNSIFCSCFKAAPIRRPARFAALALAAASTLPFSAEATTQMMRVCTSSGFKYMPFDQTSDAPGEEDDNNPAACHGPCVIDRKKSSDQGKKR